MRLRTRFSFLTSGLVILVIAAVGIVLFIFEKQMLTKEIKNNQVTMINSLAQVAKESLILQDDLMLFNYLKLVAANRGVNYAIIMDSRGKVISHSNGKFIGTILSDSISKNIIKTQKELKEVYFCTYMNDNRVKILEIGAPVIRADKIERIARIGFLQDVINSTVNNTLKKTRNRIFGVAVWALILGLIGSLILARMLSKPIDELAQGAKLIGEGKLDYRINVKGDYELDGLAEEFNLMAKKLQELDEMKNDFVSSVTHELRSPLTAIKGYVEFLVDGKAGPMNDRQTEYLNIVKNNTARLGRFINDVLDLAKIEAGQMEIIQEPIDFFNVAKEIGTLFKPLAEEKKINLAIDSAESIPKIQADVDKLRQVITNLVSNALKFTPEGGEIIIRAKKQDDIFLQIQVKDSGIGIPPDELNQVFDKFHQVKGMRDKIRGPKGTGLGLTIVKGIIEAHKGKIWVESEVNKGTSFFFTLPISDRA